MMNKSSKLLSMISTGISESPKITDGMKRAADEIRKFTGNTYCLSIYANNFEPNTIDVALNTDMDDVPDKYLHEITKIGRKYNVEVYPSRAVYGSDLVPI